MELPLLARAMITIFIEKVLNTRSPAVVAKAKLIMGEDIFTEKINFAKC